MSTNSLAAASVTEDRGQDVDQLSSRIDSTNTKSAAANQAQLIKVIKAHLAKGDKAASKADDHYLAAGQYLKELKGGLTQAEFLDIVREQIGIGKSRIYELLAIADGTKTVEQVRADTAQRTAQTKARLKLSASSGQNADTPKASAETADDGGVNVSAGKTGDALHTELLRAALRAAVRDRELGIATINPLTIVWDAADKNMRADFAGDRWDAIMRASKQTIADLEKDDDGDSDIEETEADPPRRRGRKSKFEEMKLGAAVSNAFIVFEELGGECRDVVDNAPEGLSQTQW
jgi:hypothetical protein